MPMFDIFLGPGIVLTKQQPYDKTAIPVHFALLATWSGRTQRDIQEKLRHVLEARYRLCPYCRQDIGYGGF